MTTPENFDGNNENGLLLSSYNCILDKSRLEIVIDKQEKESVRKILFETLQLDFTLEDFSIQNLFKLKSLNGNFYIGQCLSDFGYSYGGGKYDREYRHRYYYDIIGFGILKDDLGQTLIRQKTTADKLIEHFVHTTIKIDNCEVFNSKFYLISDKKENMLKCFDSPFIKTISKYEGISIKTINNKMLLAFENHLEETQSKTVEDIFSSFKYWAE